MGTNSRFQKQDCPLPNSLRLDWSLEFLQRRGWRPSGIVYVGDNAVDEPVAEMLPRGHFIVPFLAPSEFKQHMSTKHGAFVPETTDELSAYLSSM